MLFLCVLPVAYAIVWLEPSWHCGPFSGNDRIYYLFTKTIKKIVPKAAHKFLDYIASPAAIIPLLLLLVLFIYYLISVTGALREANLDLKNQLHKERTEERKKMMKFMENRINHTVKMTNLTDRWKRVSTTDKSAPATATPMSLLTINDDSAVKGNMLLAKAMSNMLKRKKGQTEVAAIEKAEIIQNLKNVDNEVRDDKIEKIDVLKPVDQIEIVEEKIEIVQLPVTDVKIIQEL